MSESKIGRPPRLKHADEWELYCYRKSGVAIKTCASMYRVGSRGCAPRDLLMYQNITIGGFMKVLFCLLLLTSSAFAAEYEYQIPMSGTWTDVDGGNVSTQNVSDVIIVHVYLTAPLPANLHVTAVPVLNWDVACNYCAPFFNTADAGVSGAANAFAGVLVVSTDRHGVIYWWSFDFSDRFHYPDNADYFNDFTSGLHDSVDATEALSGHQFTLIMDGKKGTWKRIR